MNVINLHGAREAPRAARAKMETLLLTPDAVQEWRIPPFQRPLRVNAKVLALSEELKENGGIIKGIVWLGTVGDDRKTHYLYDGQHRMEAAKLSGLPEFIADVGYNHFDTMAEMADEFVAINTQLARLKPDDVMRGLEASTPALRMIRQGAPFVGYDQIRRGPANPLLSMASVIRCWLTTTGDTPSLSGAYGSAAMLASNMTEDDARGLVEFLKVAFAAWRHDPETYRLWGNLNISLCMWLWRQLVKAERRSGSTSTRLSSDQFKRCLMSVAATRDYLEWLVGRNMTDRDRSPAYARLKAVFQTRLKLDGISNTKLPSPAWVASR